MHTNSVVTVIGGRVLRRGGAVEAGRRITGATVDGGVGRGR